ncbi:Wadjet anti-phage system protein JetD domain-containing protein [Prosthecobacter sp.]|uniref:Wadjet anti-phage system protein JetD domain-containing protein n=1 Tax=Prosthecobacter sp. TaxID=1965333 RepID=UPI00378310D9
MAREHPDILKVFADRYRASQAGRTGVSSGDFTLDYLDLIKAAGIEKSADGRRLAEDRLCVARRVSQGLLGLKTHPHDERIIELVRLARDGGEPWLFTHLGETSPTEERHQLASLFESFSDAEVPAAWQEPWRQWCALLVSQARQGTTVLPFVRNDPAACRELMSVTARVLNWQQGESLLRFASCLICGNSKRLEQLEKSLEKTLSQITGGAIQSLKDLGLLEKPRRVLLHGPLRLELPAGALDLGLLSGPLTLSETDIHLASAIHTAAQRVLTVENETTFWELTKTNHDTLLIHTSFPGRAVLALITRLPSDIPLYHFGDTDPAGFDILRDLRERSGRTIQPLHMSLRAKGSSETLTASELRMLKSLLSHPLMHDCREQLQAMLDAGTKCDFEQETLGVPPLKEWPFYRTA